jgi:hypothetical protein
MGAWVLPKSLIVLPAAACALLVCGFAFAQDAETPARKKKPLSLNQDPAFFTRKDNVADGSSSVTYGTRLPTDFETKVGVDVGVRSSPVVPDPERLINRGATNGNSGSAWATLTMPTGPLGIDASSNAKLDSAQDEGKLGLGLSRKLPINDRLQMKLKSDYGVTNTLPAAPAPGAQSAGSSIGQSWETRRAVELDLLRSETSITAGQHMTSGEEKWLRSLSAEQKIYGPLSITGGIAETSSGTLDKSLKAGFKKTW